MSQVIDRLSSLKRWISYKLKQCKLKDQTGHESASKRPLMQIKFSHNKVADSENHCYLVFFSTSYHLLLSDTGSYAIQFLCLFNMRILFSARLSSVS